MGHSPPYLGSKPKRGLTMAVKPILPRWLTPERQALLVELWRLFGNRCLLGHSVCSEASHYIHYEAKSSWASKAVYLPCLDRAGNPIKGKYLKLYTPVKVGEFEANYTRLFDVLAEQQISDWKAQDRLQRIEEYRQESLRLHSLAEPRQPLRGRFSAISKDIWEGSKPLFYIEGIGISGLTLYPFVRVRLASSYMRLYVNLGEALRGVSKSKKRKAIRYGKPLPKAIDEIVNQLVRTSVLHYLSH